MRAFRISALPAEIRRADPIKAVLLVAGFALMLASPSSPGLCQRIGKLRASKAPENTAAGFLDFTETLKQWEDSAEHRENPLMPGASWRRLGCRGEAAISFI
jgi:hypothetical protein